MKRKLAQNRWMLVLGAMALAAPLGSSGAAAAIAPCSSATVAFVKSIKGEGTNVVLARGGEEAQLAPFSPLCTGDVLKLKTADEAVVLGLAGSTAPAEVVGPVAYNVGPASSGGEALTEVLEDRLLPLGERTIGQGLARSADPFEFGLLDLETESAQIGAGHRPLWVGWAGGKPPFDMTVTGPSGQTLEMRALEANDYLFPASDIELGRYSVSISDANGRTRETGFEAVSDVPEVATVSVPAWMGADSGAMLKAFCVAAEDPYTWSFEAAQQLAAAPDAGLDRETALALIGSGDTVALCPGGNG